uniref:uncharacterized protein n=1 Tax=Centroberyx gerrardi TaxID=166262 RepID=UPI003AADE183
MFTIMFSMGIKWLPAALIEWILITAVLSEGQSEIQNVSGKVGGSITLQTGVTGLQGDYHVTWSDDDNSVLVNDYKGDLNLNYTERFRGRLQLDRGSGSLTITHLNINDTGVYHVQIIDGSSKRHNRSFNLTVSVTAVQSEGESEIQNVPGKVGDSITLQTGVSGLQGDYHVTWSDDDNSVLADDYKGDLNLNYTERFRGRLQLDRGSGSLTITHLNINDTGVYHVQFIDGSSKIHYHSFNLTVSITAVQSEGQSEIQNVPGKVAESITLQTRVSGLQGDYQVTWSDDDNSVLADDYKGDLNLNYTERFRGRLQLDRGSGSLTITHLNINDTGVYHVQFIDGSSKIHYHSFNLTVSNADPEPPTSAAPPSAAAASWVTHLAAG